MADLYICGDTGWCPSPRYAPQDVLDSDGTIMHYLSNPSAKRTLVGYYEGDGSSYGLGISGGTATINGVEGIVLSVVGQRLQNIGDDQWWRITVEMQQEYSG